MTPQLRHTDSPRSVEADLLARDARPARSLLFLVKTRGSAGQFHKPDGSVLQPLLTRACTDASPVELRTRTCGYATGGSR